MISKILSLVLITIMTLIYTPTAHAYGDRIRPGDIPGNYKINLDTVNGTPSSVFGFLPADVLYNFHRDRSLSAHEPNFFNPNDTADRDPFVGEWKIVSISKDKIVLKFSLLNTYFDGQQLLVPGCNANTCRTEILGSITVNKDGSVSGYYHLTIVDLNGNLQPFPLYLSGENYTLVNFSGVKYGIEQVEDSFQSNGADLP